MTNIFKKFGQLFKGNRKSRKKASPAVFASATSAPELSAAEIIKSGNIRGIESLLKAGITAETMIKNDAGKDMSIGQLAVEIVDQRIDEMKQAATDFHMENWESLAALDHAAKHVQSRVLVGGDHVKYMRATAFLHAKEMLDNMGVSAEKRPQFIFSAEGLDALASDRFAGAYDQYNTSLYAVQKLTGTETATDPQEIKNALHASGAADDFDALLDKSMDVSNVESMQSHIAQAKLMREIQQDGVTDDELLEWANDPYLQYHYRFLADVPGAVQYTDEYFKSFEKMMQHEQELALAAQRAEQQAAQEKAQEMQARMDENPLLLNEAYEAIKQNNIEAAQQIFGAEKLDGNTAILLGEGGAPTNFINLAAEEYHTARVIAAQRTLEEVSENNSHTIEALNYIDQINDFDAIDDALLFMHEDVLQHMGLHEMNIFIATSDAEDAAFVKEIQTRSDNVLRMTLNVDADASLQQAVADAAKQNPANHEALSLVNDAVQNNAEWEQHYMFEMLAKSDKEAKNFFAQDAEYRAQRIIAAANKPEVLKTLPYLSVVAAQCSEFIAEKQNTKVTVEDSVAVSQEDFASDVADDVKHDDIKQSDAIAADYDDGLDVTVEAVEEADAGADVAVAEAETVVADNIEVDIAQEEKRSFNDWMNMMKVNREEAVTKKEEAPTQNVQAATWNSTMTTSYSFRK